MMDNFHPMRFANDCGFALAGVMCRRNAVNVMLDPGWRLVRVPIQPPSVPAMARQLLDLTGKTHRSGCGSGILAIAALKLGAAKAIGIDIDPQAIQASQR